MKIGIVESFYTGSHKYWADQLCDFYPTAKLFSTPGKHWKWRMQGAAIELAKQINTHEEHFDVLIVSSLINLPLLKSLLRKNSKLIVYFHENQFVYPKSSKDTDIKGNRDNHYAFLNFASALCADKVVFNSNFNKSSFLEGAGKLLNKMPDYPNKDSIDSIRNKSNVIGIGVQEKTPFKNTKEPVILWNHRWEEDKNYEEFLTLINHIKSNFKLVITGKGTNSEEVKNALQKHKDRILHLGYIQNKKEYFEVLSNAVVLPVTSNHDFFGISTIEAIQLGCTPILPRRMAYPEHIPNELSEYFLYNSFDELLTKTEKALSGNTNLKPLQLFLEKYHPNNIKQLWDELLFH